ncbi:MAG: hypothetical protein A4S09_12915 [Proteobacteria bacterium SG_bin7]|nr:MAG: hypothetical protein A4S09_12915 [Proteobacteria bacterium SG_bin7]
MKTFRGWLVIIFSMLGLHGWAESLDPVSDEAETIESWDEANFLENLRNQIESQKGLDENTTFLEKKLQILDAEPTGNRGGG